MKKLTIHMIGNAHLDPVWQWRWPAGVDEALATCRSACDFLDDYPELFITRGEAWVHHQVEKLNPELFARIAEHVAAGRWRVVNGWWIQPDCNFPSAKSFAKHAEIGGGYFRDKFGIDVTVGYNVDSFGHGAYLPAFLRKAGMESYVFMRPEEKEKRLDSDIFEWRAPSGESVTAFRISAAYCCLDTSEYGIKRNLAATIERADRRIGHSMCFYGVGDHGGGPTRAQIEWIKEHSDYGDGVELVFSHPRAFFDAVAESAVNLPVITGELQFHAIGCYSAVHDIKKSMRQAETTAIFAENAARIHPGHTAENWKDRLEEAWRRVLFNQFHDILGGCSIKAACDDALDELGMAKTIGNEIIVETTRKALRDLPPSPNARLVATNLGDRVFKGFLKFEPWNTAAGKKMIDENGEEIPTQFVDVDAVVDDRTAFLFRAEIPPRSVKIIEIANSAENENDDMPPSPFEIEKNSIANSAATLKLKNDGLELAASSAEASVEIKAEMFEDDSDTWTHRLPSYDGKKIGVFNGDGNWRNLENGKLRATSMTSTELEKSSILWTASLDSETSGLTLKLRIDWRAQAKILKLTLKPSFNPDRRIDGVSGGELERALDGREYPIRDFVAIEGGNTALSVLTRDVFATDVQPDGTIRLTLLRSPLYLHHEPRKVETPHAYPTTDQGIHEFEFRVTLSRKFDPDLVAEQAAELANPVVFAEHTLGMYAKTAPAPF